MKLNWLFWFPTFPIVQKWQRNWPKLRRLAVFLLVFCLRESIQVKNNPNLQKMLEEDILYVTRQCRTLVLLLSKLNGKEFSQRSVILRILKDAQKYAANKSRWSDPNDDAKKFLALSKVILRPSNRTQRVLSLLIMMKNTKCCHNRKFDLDSLIMMM